MHLRSVLKKYEEILCKELSLKALCPETPQCVIPLSSNRRLNYQGQDRMQTTREQDRKLVAEADVIF